VLLEGSTVSAVLVGKCGDGGDGKIQRHTNLTEGDPRIHKTASVDLPSIKKVVGIG
jgi:hypothetical protein